MTHAIHILNLKNAFPFRVGATSYVVPDEILPNVALLANKVDDVELVLFESDEISNLPEPDEVAHLHDLGKSHDLSYTVHLPLDIVPGAADDQVRRASVDKCRRVIELMQPLQPFAWILHLVGDRRGATPSNDLAHWQAQLARTLETLTPLLDEPSWLCIETLEYPFELVASLVAAAGCSYCMDIGHLLHNGYDPDAYLAAHWTLTRVLHLHGIRDARDHGPLTFLPAGTLTKIMALLLSEPVTPRAVTLEVFNAEDLDASLRVLAEMRP